MRGGNREAEFAAPVPACEDAVTPECPDHRGPPPHLLRALFDKLLTQTPDTGIVSALGTLFSLPLETGTERERETEGGWSKAQGSSTQEVSPVLNFEPRAWRSRLSPSLMPSDEACECSFQAWAWAREWWTNNDDCRAAYGSDGNAWIS